MMMHLLTPRAYASALALLALPLALQAQSANAGFEKIDPEGQYAELKIIQEDGSVYRTPVEDWEGARQRVANDPEWAAWLAKQKKMVDEWMERHEDRTEWVCGVWSRFVSPVDGSFLVWTDEVPGEETDFLMSRNGDRVEVTETIKQSWVYGFRARHFKRMVTAARLYRLTGEQKYADWAAEQLDFYAENEDAFPVRDTRSRIGGASLTDANYLTDMTETARLLFNDVSEERRQYWFDHLFKPEVDLLNMSMQQTHNIAVWQRSSQAQVALLYDSPEIWARVIDGPHGLREQIREGVTSDYLWYEQSMGYNGYVVRASQQLFLFAGLVGKKDQLKEEAAILQNLMLSPLFIRFPNDNLPNPADIYGIAKVQTQVLADNARTFPTVLGVQKAAQARNWNTLLDPIEVPEDDEHPVYPEVVSRNMESTCFALLKDNNWQLFFHYGQLTKSHSQAEALNWSAYYKGEVVSQDVGTTGYGSAQHKQYYSKGLAHNVPLINGEGQERWQPGELLSFDAEGPELSVSATQPEYRSNASATRTLTLVDDELIEETTVELNEGSAPALLGLSMNLYGQPELGEAFTPVDDFAKDRPEAFRYWKDVRAASFTDEAVFDVVLEGGQVMQLLVETEGPFTLYQGSVPERLPARRAGFYLEKDDKATSASFTVTLTPIIMP
ncbi:MAG: heparinase II/III domain-containing protein [Puniceicoccales bacterium]